MLKDGHPNDTAFPCSENADGTVNNFGLTKREYFAALAMQGLLTATNGDQWSAEIVAEGAINAADELLAALSAKPESPETDAVTRRCYFCGAAESDHIGPGDRSGRRTCPPWAQGGETDEEEAARRHVTIDAIREERGGKSNA